MYRLDKKMKRKIARRKMKLDMMMLPNNDEESGMKDLQHDDDGKEEELEEQAEKVEEAEGLNMVEEKNTETSIPTAAIKHDLLSSPYKIVKTENEEDEEEEENVIEEGDKINNEGDGEKVDGEQQQQQQQRQDGKPNHDGSEVVESNVAEVDNVTSSENVSIG